MEDAFMHQLRLDHKMSLAVRRGQPDKIAALIDSGAAPNGGRYDDCHPLCLAIRFRQPASMLALLEGGASPFPAFSKAYNRSYALTATFQVLRELGSETANMSQEERRKFDECKAIFSSSYPAKKLVRIGGSVFGEQVALMNKDQGPGGNRKFTSGYPLVGEIVAACQSWLEALAIYMPENFSKQLTLLAPKLPPLDRLWERLLRNSKTSKAVLDELIKVNNVHCYPCKIYPNDRFSAAALSHAWHRNCSKDDPVKPTEAQLWTLYYLLSVSEQKAQTFDGILEDLLSHMKGAEHRFFLTALDVHPLGRRVKEIHFTAGLLGSCNQPSTMSSWLSFTKGALGARLKDEHIVKLISAGNDASVRVALKNVEDPNKLLEPSKILIGVHAVRNCKMADFKKLERTLESFGVDLNLADNGGATAAGILAKIYSTPEYVARMARQQQRTLDKVVTTPALLKPRGRL
jgi:hypothetical protein